MTLTLDGVGGRHAPAAFTPRKDLVSIVHEAGWAPGLAWIGAENLAPTRIRTLELPARSESLYQLRYPSPHMYDGSPTKSSKPWQTAIITCIISLFHCPVCTKYQRMWTRLYKSMYPIGKRPTRTPKTSRIIQHSKHQSWSHKTVEGIVLTNGEEVTKNTVGGCWGIYRTATPTAGFSLSRMTPNNIFNSLYSFAQKKFQLGSI